MTFLADESVLDALTETFAVNHELELGDRLIAALRAAAQPEERRDRCARPGS